MLGRQHLAISTATSLGLITPFFHIRPALSLVFLFGTVIGSLIPDVDGSDALIFHHKIMRTRKSYVELLNIFPGLVLPIFGYVTKYAVYLPSLLLFRILLPRHYEPEYGHRMYMHSLLGITVTMLITGVYLVALLSFMVPLGQSGLMVLAAFFLGYIFGGLLHLVEDACTKSGVMFFYPFSKRRVKGELVTGKDKVKPLLLTTALVTIATAGMYMTHTFDSQTALEAVLSLNMAIWAVFLGFIAKITVNR